MVVESLAPLITPCSTSPKSLKTDMMKIGKTMMMLIFKTNVMMIVKMMFVVAK